MTQGFVPDTAVVPPALPAKKPYPSILGALGMTLLLLLATLLFSIAYTAWVFFMDALAGPDRPLEDALFPYVILGNAVIFPAFILYGWWRSGLPFTEAFALRRVPLMAYALLIPASVGFQILISEVDNVLRRFFPLPDIMAEFMEILGDHVALMGFVLIVMAPLTEEFIFRGLMLRGFLRRYRPWVAIVASAFFFALIHVNPAQLIPAFAIGLFYGWFFVRMPSIWPFVFAHALHNGLIFFMMTFKPFMIPGYNILEPEAHQPLWFTGTGLLVFLVSLLAIRIWLKREREASECPVERVDESHVCG